MRYLSPREAQARFNDAGHPVSHVTIIRWCHAHEGLGLRIGARHRLPEPAVEEILAGVPLAVVAQHMRERGHAKVAA